MPAAGDGLPVWVVYDHPADNPFNYVARCWIYEKPTENVLISPDLERLRDALTKMGLVKLMPMPGDDPVILETWL